jgi:hypothetical protein
MKAFLITLFIIVSLKLNLLYGLTDSSIYGNIGWKYSSDENLHFHNLKFSTWNAVSKFIGYKAFQT